MNIPGDGKCYEENEAEQRDGECCFIQGNQESSLWLLGSVPKQEFRSSPILKPGVEKWLYLYTWVWALIFNREVHVSMAC